MSRICGALMDLNQLARDAEKYNSEHNDNEDDESEGLDEEHSNNKHITMNDRMSSSTTSSITTTTAFLSESQGCREYYSYIRQYLCTSKIAQREACHPSNKK